MERLDPAASGRELKAWKPGKMLKVRRKRRRRRRKSIHCRPGGKAMPPGPARIAEGQEDDLKQEGR